MVPSCGLEMSDSGQGLVAGYCERDNEPSGGINGGGFFWPAEWLSASEDGLCSTEKSAAHSCVAGSIPFRDSDIFSRILLVALW